MRPRSLRVPVTGSSIKKWYLKYGYGTTLSKLNNNHDLFRILNERLMYFKKQTCMGDIGILKDQTIKWSI